MMSVSAQIRVGGYFRWFLAKSDPRFYAANTGIGIRITVEVPVKFQSDWKA